MCSVVVYNHVCTCIHTYIICTYIFYYSRPVCFHVHTIGSVEELEEKRANYNLQLERKRKALQEVRMYVCDCVYVCFKP